MADQFTHCRAWDASSALLTPREGVAGGGPAADVFMCCRRKSDTARVHIYANEMLICTQLKS